MERQLFSSGLPAEDYAGFSAAVRVGTMVFVSGTNASDKEGNIQHPDDVEAQTRDTLDSIRAALEQAGASLGDVVRTRVFLRQVKDAPAVAKVHNEYFSKIRPANSFVRAEPMEDDMLVEIEADAIVPA